VLVGGRPVVDGPLYTFPTLGLLAVGVASVPLGLARRALDELVPIAADRIPMGSSRPLSQQPAVQRAVAEASAIIGAARSYLRDTVAAAWEAALGGARLERDQRIGLRLAAVHTTWEAARAVEMLYHAAGGASAQPEGVVVARCFRDVNVATQHGMVSRRMFETIGRHRLGLDAAEL
jgi:alkylation response protein AidB-like acyl-CoA dehydrogenase